MSFIYKNPNIGNTLSEPNVVTRSAVIGTNYSVLETGGYREVWGLKDLNFQTFGGSGTIENSGNTIPINYQKSIGNDNAVQEAKDLLKSLGYDPIDYGL